MKIKLGQTIERPSPEKPDAVGRQITQRIIYVYIFERMQIIGIGSNEGEWSRKS